MKTITALSFLFINLHCFAQPFYNHWDVAATFGTSHYSGEIANHSTLHTLVNELNFQMGLEVNYHITKTNTIGFESTIGQWYATDANHLNLYDRNFQGSSNYAFIGLQFKHYFFANKGWELKPYIGAGSGGLFHKTKISRNGETAQNNFPKPLPIKPSSAPPPPESYGASFGFTFTGGVTYSINKKTSLSLEAWLSLYPDDNIDFLIYAVREPDKIASIRLKFAYKLVDLNKRRGLK